MKKSGRCGALTKALSICSSVYSRKPQADKMEIGEPNHIRLKPFGGADACKTLHKASSNLAISLCH